MNRDANRIRGISFLGVILGFFIAVLDTTIINIVIPEIRQHYDTTVSNVSWIIFAYNIAFAALLITTSRIADQFGRKKIFMIGLSLFILTSFLCAVSGSIEMIIVMRTIQGLSAAMIVPVTLPLALGLFPREAHGKVLAAWGAITGLAAACGPALGGILTHFFEWQAVFYVNIPIGLISLIVTARLLNESYDKTASKRIDWLGMILITGSMFAITLALIQANEKGWDSVYILSLFAAGAVSLILFIVTELKVKEPMLQMSLFRIGAFVSSNVTLLVLTAGMMCGSFLLAMYLTTFLGYSILSAGLTIMAMPLTAFVGSAVIGKLDKKVKAKVSATIGMVLLTLAVFFFGGVDGDSGRGDIIWRLCVAGAGIGLTLAPVTGAAVRSVPRDKIGIVSGVTNLFRVIGMVFGTAIMVTLLNMNSDNGQTSMDTAFSDTFYVMSGIMVLGIVTALFCEKKPGKQTRLDSKAPASTNVN